MPTTYLKTTLVNPEEVDPDSFDSGPLSPPFITQDPTSADISWAVVTFIGGDDALVKLKGPQDRYDKITSRDDVVVLNDDEVLKEFQNSTGRDVSFEELDSRYNLR